jgi:CheY-like chemotaxis protein
MSMKLRFVDEDPAALDMVKSLVGPLGYEVLALADSRQAAECVNKQKFDGV